MSSNPEQYLPTTLFMTANATPNMPTRNFTNLWQRVYPWLVISICALFLFYKYVLQVSPSVMTHELMQAFNMTGAELGNLAACYFYAYLVAQLVAGPLLDRYSPRFLTIFAILLSAIGAFAFAHIHSLFAAGCARALIGVGAAFATVTYMKMSAIWFTRERIALVDGLLATAAMLGALCGQLPLTLLVSKVGWQHSIAICGFFGLGLAALFLLVVRDQRPTPAPNSALNVPKKSAALKWTDFVALLKDKRNWLLTFYSGLAFTPIAVLGGLWGNPFFEIAHHLSGATAASFTSLIFIGLAIGAPLFGLFADHLGNRVHVMFVGTSIALVSLTAAIYGASLPLWLFGALLFLFGLGSGCFMLSFPLGKEINPLGLAATVVALVNTGDALFGSFTEPLIGKILDYGWNGQIVAGIHQFTLNNYFYAFALLPLYLVAGLVCLGLLKRCGAG